MKRAVRTLRENREGIHNHFGSRPANAYMEGANFLIQLIKKTVRGLRNVEDCHRGNLPQTGEPVVRRPRLRVVLTCATHQKLRRAKNRTLGIECMCVGYMHHAGWQQCSHTRQSHSNEGRR